MIDINLVGLFFDEDAWASLRPWQAPDGMSFDRWHDAYYASPEWRARRQMILARDRDACVRCGRKKPGVNLHVHHKTYERFGQELPEDLETLCDGCHREEHGVV